MGRARYRPGGGASSTRRFRRLLPAVLATREPSALTPRTSPRLRQRLVLLGRPHRCHLLSQSRGSRWQLPGTWETGETQSRQALGRVGAGDSGTTTRPCAAALSFLETGARASRRHSRLFAFATPGGSLRQGQVSVKGRFKNTISLICEKYVCSEWNFWGRRTNIKWMKTIRNSFT